MLSHSQGFRLSLQQEQQWRLSQHGAAAQCVLRLDGPLDPQRLQRALQQVVARHDLLRTIFRRLPGLTVPVQVIGDQAALSWQAVDQPHDDPQRQRQALDLAAQQERDRPFVLHEGPLLRACLLRFSSQQHGLIVTVPTLYADTHSLTILRRELLAAYADPDADDDPDDVTQYLQFSEWQHALLEDDESAAGRAYWQQLPPPIAPVTLPGEQVRPVAERAVLELVGAQLDATQTAALAALAEQLDSSTERLVLACWYVLLWRLSGQPHIGLELVLDGRSYEELAEIIGVLARTLPLQQELAADFALRDVLAQLQQALDERLAWLDTLVEQPAPGQPGATIGFEYERRPVDPVVAGLRSTVVQQMVLARPFKLKLHAIEHAAGLRLELHFDPRRFAADTIGCLADQLSTLLVSVCRMPELPIGRLELLSDTQRRRLLVELNATATAYPERCFHELFAAQARRTPTQIAVVDQHGQLSYAELDAQADQLAWQLQQLGAGPDTLVGLAIERSLALVVGLLGILKAGSAFVPLDRSYPRERLALILEDARCPIIVTQPQHVDQLAAHNAAVVLLGPDLPPLAGAAARPSPAADLDQLAYVLYTSGSTGRPKGVMITQRGLVNYLSWCLTAYHGDGGAPVHSPIGFDLTITSLFAPLLSGQRVLLLPEDGGIEALSAALHAGHRFSLLKLTPAHLEALSHVLRPDRLAGARTLIVGGEALYAAQVAGWRDAAPDSRIINEYGPTETVVGCCAYQVSGDEAAAGSLPIGRPIANTQLYVVDAQLQPVPIGVVGELLIGGAGVARGYLRQPALTAERFIPDPFSRADDARPGARLYRSGDLVRVRADGVLEFLGRNDQQVKLRGYRIELGEIAAVLRQHPRLRDVAVLLRDDQGDQRLVAYIVEEPSIKNQAPTDGPNGSGLAQSVLGSHELRAFLEPRLPDYMIPTVFVTLAALPLTANGKINYRALPAPAARASRVPYVAPRDEAERTLAAVWAAVLRREQIGIHDNFFDLGGDSILSVQIVARAYQRGLQFTPKQMFDHQTIAQLAMVAVAATPALHEQGLVTGAAPLVPIQRWFFEQPLPTPQHWNQSVLLAVARELVPAALAEIVRELQLHHDGLRARFSATAQGWQQVIAGPSAITALIQIDLSGLAQPEQTRRLEQTAAELHTSLDLERGPLVRAALFDLGPAQPRRLLIVIHHLLVDGVSWRILLEDLEAAAQQASAGAPIQLLPKTSSFKRWAERLATFAQSAQLQAEAGFWQAQQAQPSPQLPRDHETDAAQPLTVGTAQTVSLMLDADTTRALLQELPAWQRTEINDVLLTALVEAFAGWTGSRLLRLDLEGHGREPLFDDVDLSRTVGWFTTLYPLLLDLRDQHTPVDALRSVKQQLRAIPQRGIGCGVLRYLADEPQRLALRQAQQPEVVFNYLGQFDQVLSAASLFQPAPELSGPNISPDSPRSHLIEITAAVGGGVLSVDWTFSPQVHARATVERLAELFMAALKTVITASQAASGGRTAYTPADVPLVQLTQPQLDALVADLAVADIYPLMASQREMLEHTRAHAGSWAYFNQLRCVLAGSFDPFAFRQSCQQMLDRHAALRAVFRWLPDAAPVQLIRAAVALPFNELDWSAQPAAEQTAALARLFEDDRARGFDLADGPLLRMTLVKLAADRYQFVWSHHHALIDGWCTSVLLNEVFMLYHALRSGQPLLLSPPPPYSAYLAWLQQQNWSEAAAFWRETLAGFRPPQPLVATSPDLPEQARYAEATLALSHELSERLQALVRQQRLTLNTLVQGCWALLLSRLRASSDVVFGVTLAGRPAELPEVEQMIGLFINTLPLRVRVDPALSARSWLQQIQRQQVALRQYEALPLSMLQQWCGYEPGVPLFESVLRFENYPVEAVAESLSLGLRADEFASLDRWPYPLCLMAKPGAALAFEISYQRAYVSPATVEQLLLSLAALIESIVGDPEQPLSSLLRTIAAVDEVG